MTRRFGIFLALVAVGVSAIGCEGEAPVASMPPDLGVPWQPVPVAIDPAILPAVLASCAAQMRPGLRAADVAAVDVRGGNRVYLVTRRGGDCLTTRRADGRFEAVMSGGADGGQPPEPPFGGLQLFGTGSFGDATETTSTVIGQVGPGVAGVVLRAGSARIQASVGGGWFLAWWPGSGSPQDFQAFGPDGQPTGARVP